MLVGLNLPGCFSNLLIPGGHRTPASMHPEAWKAIVYPLYCLPFWALLGRPLDGLLNRISIRWPLLLVGLILFVFFCFCSIAFMFGMSPAERSELVFPVWSFALWAVLMAAFPIQWIAQRRRARRHPPEPAPGGPSFA